MANYRDTLDALNALVDEQRRTNELLEQLIKLHTNTTVIQPINKPIQKQSQQSGRKAQ